LCAIAIYIRNNALYVHPRNRLCNINRLCKGTTIVISNSYRINPCSQRINILARLTITSKISKGEARTSYRKIDGSIGAAIATDIHMGLGSTHALWRLGHRHGV